MFDGCHIHEIYSGYPDREASRWRRGAITKVVDRAWNSEFSRLRVQLFFYICLFIRAINAISACWVLSSKEGH